MSPSEEDMKKVPRSYGVGVSGKCERKVMHTNCIGYASCVTGGERGIIIIIIIIIIIAISAFLGHNPTAPHPHPPKKEKEFYIVSGRRG